MARVAILTAEYDPFKGGIATFVRELANAGAELGHKITVFAPDYRSDDAISSGPKVKLQRFRAGAYSGRWYPAYIKTALAASRGPYDQIVAGDLAFLESLALVSGATGQPFDAFVHGSDLNRSHNSAKGLILAPFKVFGRPRRVFANSRFTRSLLLQNFPYVDPSRITVAHLGVGPQWFEATDPRSIRDRLGLQNERIIACVGRITRRKGQLTLFQALATPELDRPGLAIVIAGRPSVREADFALELRNAASDLKYVRAIFVEDLNDQEVRSLYAASDVFCLPGSANTSAVEGFGLVYLEAGAQGVPSVAGAVGGVPEVICGGETGLLVPADNPANLRDALVSLLDDEGTRQRMGNAAKSRAWEFTWRRCAQTIFGPSAAVEGAK
jgi:glycosyltransferase involved in cell wall biosynthesis